MDTNVVFIMTVAAIVIFIFSTISYWNCL